MVELRADMGGQGSGKGGGVGFYLDSRGLSKYIPSALLNRGEVNPSPCFDQQLSECERPRSNTVMELNRTIGVRENLKFSRTCP